MDINKMCHLLLKDVYSYDISACHYQIVKQLGYDISKLDAEDKLKRNTQIGMMMRDNPKLTSLIRGITESTIGDYLTRNNVTEDELIIRQYDGVIVTKLLHETNLHLPLDKRDCFEHMLISIDRKTYIARVGSKTIIKGIPYRYPAMDQMYEKILKINFASKTQVFKSLQKIHDEIIIHGNASLYAIPTSTGLCNVFLKDYGQTQISKSMVNIMDPDDINKERYYDFYIRPFAESLVIEFA